MNTASRMARIGTALLLAAMGALGAACQAAQPVVAAPPAAQQIPEDYIIGPGDMLQIFVFQNPDLSQKIPVRPDGKISTPLAENVVAVGKTTSQLARDLETVLGEFVKTPRVNVIVDTAVSTFSQVKVIGQVKQPQALPYRAGLTVLDVVLLSGGVTDFAAPNKAHIARTGKNGKTQKVKVRLGALLNGGDMKQNVTLLPGDVLVVPQSMF
jgi:polysaccharide biosynthesis/export protein